MIKVTENRYGGLTIDNATLPESKEQFRTEIERIIESSLNNELLWVQIPIEKSELIPVLTQSGFEFHNCEEKSLMLVRKLKNNAFVPATKNYIVGIGAVVMLHGKLLVVKDKYYNGYKLPGGHVDKGETLKEAVKREVYEETGISIEFESIMNLGHFRNGQFGESNIYLVCTANAKNDRISINDSAEIVDAKWISPEEFLNSDEANNYNKSVVKAAINNTDLKLIDRKVKLRVEGGEVFY